MDSIGKNGSVHADEEMKIIKKIITISDREINDESLTFWLSRTPEERVEAVETIRENYYQMLGYRTAPRIKKIIMIK